MSVDPPLKGPEGWAEHGLAATTYGFVAGNPVLLWDPDGNRPLKPENLALARTFIQNSRARSGASAPIVSDSQARHYRPNLEGRVRAVQSPFDGEAKGVATYEPLDDKGRPTGGMALLHSRGPNGGTKPSRHLEPPGYSREFAANDVPMELKHSRGHLTAKDKGGLGNDPRNMTQEFATANQKQGAYEGNKFEPSTFFLVSARTPIYLSENSTAPDGFLYEQFSCTALPKPIGREPWCTESAYVVVNGGDSESVEIEGFLVPRPPSP